jgi:hypothetical protein
LTGLSVHNKYSSVWNQLDLRGFVSLTSLEIALNTETPSAQCPTALRRLTVSGTCRHQWPASLFIDLPNLVDIRLQEGTSAELAAMLLHCRNLETIRFPPFSNQRLPFISPVSVSSSPSPLDELEQCAYTFPLRVLRGAVLDGNETAILCCRFPKLETLDFYTNATFSTTFYAIVNVCERFGSHKRVRP